MDAKEKVRKIYDSLVRNGKIIEMSERQKSEIREMFISFYSRFDKRLKKISREKVNVFVNKCGKVQACCVYYGKVYSQVY